MHAIAVLFALLLTFATQGVFCFFRNVSFSTPEQCGPFTVIFSNSSDPPVLPLSLTIVPISATPISIKLPEDTYDNSTDSGTARIIFLPFSSGTQFVASLDDAEGQSVGLVSDVLAVQKSSTTACLGPNQKGFPFYSIRGELNQCSQFNVTFNPSMINNPPAVRAFLPRYFSFPVNATGTPVSTMTFGPHSSSNGKNRRDGNDKGNTDNKGNGEGDDDDDKSNKDSNDNSDSNNNDKNSKDDDDGDSDNNNNGGSKNGTDNSNNSDNGGNGNANSSSNSSSDNPFSHGSHNISSKEYLLNVRHGFQAVLTFDDGDGHRGSSKLFTAGGTSSSPSNCFKESFNIPSRTSNASSSPSAREPERLSKTGKIAISALGASVGISLAVIILFLCRRRIKARKDLEKTSFVFTEDVDLGSSFRTTFASRVRAGISQLTYGKRSVRSYRSYRDEKDGASTWIPTSPIGSPAPLSSPELPQVEKQLSWIDFGTVFGDVPHEGPEMSTARQSRTLRASDTYTLPNLDFDYPAPPEPVKTRQLTNPDVPAPAVSRSSASSRFLLGSGYLSSRSSGTGIMPRKGENARTFNRFSLPPSAYNSANKHRSPTAVLSSDVSSSGYMPSRSSSATTRREPESRQTNNEIYVGPPIRPTPDVPDNVSSSQSESGPATSPPTTMTRDTVRDPRYSTLKGANRQDGPPRERGRILPFPIVSLRTSRSPPG